MRSFGALLLWGLLWGATLVDAQVVSRARGGAGSLEAERAPAVPSPAPVPVVEEPETDFRVRDSGVSPTEKADDGPLRAQGLPVRPRASNPFANYAPAVGLPVASVLSTAAAPMSREGLAPPDANPADVAAAVLSQAEADRLNQQMMAQYEAGAHAPKP